MYTYVYVLPTHFSLLLFVTSLKKVCRTPNLSWGVAGLVQLHLTWDWPRNSCSAFPHSEQSVSLLSITAELKQKVSTFTAAVQISVRFP